MEVSTSRGGTGASCVKPWLTRDLSRPGRSGGDEPGVEMIGGFFWFLVSSCYAATQLATQLPQRRIQVVRSDKVARKRLTESNARTSDLSILIDIYIRILF